MTRVPLSARPAHRNIDTFVLCIALGVGYALLGWLVDLASAFRFANLPPSARLSDFFGGLPVVLLYGGLTGAFWSLFAVPILCYTSLKPASFILGLVVASITIGGSILGAFRPQAVSGPFAYLWTIGPTGVFIITCLLLRRVLPGTRNVCPNCAIEMNAITGVCSSCGDTRMFRRHARYVRLLALLGIAASACIAALFMLTRSHSCGYWSHSTVVGFDQGALVIHFDPLTYEGWFWSTFSFVPMSGYVWWPIFTKKTVLIPLWVLFGFVFPPSLLAWRRSRRPPPGFCEKCGYNLTGLASGRCPECGRGFFAPAEPDY